MSTLPPRRPDVETICRLLTLDRLRSYGNGEAGDAEMHAQLDRYVRNTALSASFYGPLQAVEVAFRNAVDCEMKKIVGLDAWYSADEFIQVSPNLGKTVDKLVKRLQEERRPTFVPDIVANLSFGFWTKLVDRGPNGNHVRKFWNAGLHDAFPYYPGGEARRHRKIISDDVLRLKDFRNRIAHHEPIHNKAPEREFDRILRVAGWIAPALSGWIESHSRCRSLFDSPNTKW